MASAKAHDAAADDVTVVQKMLSATTGSVLTSLLGKPSLAPRDFSQLTLYRCSHSS